MKNLNDLMSSPGEWLGGTGPKHDIVISSRVRLARNIRGFYFSHKLDNERRTALIATVEKAISQCPLLKERMLVNNAKLTAIDNEFLVERHLISREHARDHHERAVCFTPNEALSLMILEEDHLRIQVLQSGFNLIDAWRVIDRLDSELEKYIPYAFHGQFGYLTACPTNVGTGIRVSSMLHLPALVMAKQLNKVLQALQKLNLAARGMYGEGTQAMGNFFQISNQITLGQDEPDIVEGLERVIKQIIEHEREARRVLMQKKKLRLEDQIWRSIGTLKSARILSSGEAMTLLSMTRMGVDLGLVQGLIIQQLNEIFLLIQPAHLQRMAKRSLSVRERDIRRAELIRETMKHVDLAG